MKKIFSKKNLVAIAQILLTLPALLIASTSVHAQSLGTCSPACEAGTVCNNDPIAPLCVPDTSGGGGTGGSTGTGGGGTQTCAAGTHADPLGTGACLPDQSPASPTASTGDKVPFPQDAGKDSEVWGWFASTIMSMFAWLMAIAALTLDTAMYYSVIAMSVFVKNVSAIGTTWRILRDVGNIAIIFGFLAIGISIITNAERFGWGKKMLPMLLFSAIFLNFSLFFAEAVIDVGNLFATEIYTQINGGNQPTPHTLGDFIDGKAGVATVIMNQLGLQGLYKSAQNPDQAKALFSGTSPLFVGMLGVILFLVTAFTLFSLAFILIARFITLIFIIILAPIGFAGFAIPQLRSQADKWWHQLVEQTITAPVLLLMLYVALAIITDTKFLTAWGSQGVSNSANWVGFIQNKDLAGFAGTSLSFIIAIGLLLAVSYLAKNLGAAGAGWATKMGGKLSFGAAAWAGRSTVGWGANRFNNYLKTTRFSRVPLVGTGVVRGLDRVAGASFDVRGIKAGGGLKTVGVDAGSPQKGGYKAELKSRTEARTKYAGELKGRELTDKEKMLRTKAQADVKDLEKRQTEAQKLWAQAESTRQSSLRELEGQRIILSKEDYQNRKQEINDRMKAADQTIANIKTELEKRQKEVEQIEAPTAVGAKRAYASWLSLVPLAANTDAAKKIKEEAKKSADDKTLDQLKKALKKASGEEEDKKEEKKEEAKGEKKSEEHH